MTLEESNNRVGRADFVPFFSLSKFKINHTENFFEFIIGIQTNIK